MTSFTQKPLYKIANPQSIVFFGASNNAIRMGSLMLDATLALGYEGKIYPVHPKEDTVAGFTAYRRVMDIPIIPDLAILVLPTDIVADTLEECGQKGIGHAIIVSGGFSETNAKGKKQEKRLQAIADRYSIRFLGPNCLGVINTYHRFNPTPIKADGFPGFIGLASQSGSFLTQMFNYLHLNGMGFSTGFSVGNEANIDIVECMEYLGDCPNTKVIALYIEGITRGRAFIKAAKKIVPHKPIVALYVGGSEAGRKAGFSHTGSMAGPDEIYDGMFRQAGIIRAKSLSEMFDFCLALGNLPAPKGNRVVIQTHSGGPGATAADACGRSGLELPGLSEETIKKLSPLIPHTASINNPVDMTFSKNMLSEFNDIPDALLGDPNTDILMIYFLNPNIFLQGIMEQSGLSVEEAQDKTKDIIKGISEQLFEVKVKHDKPLVGYTYRSLQEDPVKTMLQKGIPIYNDPERAAHALQALITYYGYKKRQEGGQWENH
ncbi:MAG: CoA-binding protein [Thermodesulfobacteriota bacterium]|nr:CoA-binding protein [Thermodesulfobacteriota bacterium]